MSEQTAPQAPDLGPELSITLHAAEINFVMAVLGKAPYEQVESLITKIRIQAMSSFAAAKAKENVEASAATQE